MRDVLKSLRNGVILTEALFALSPEHFRLANNILNQNDADEFQTYNNYAQLLKGLRRFYENRLGLHRQRLTPREKSAITARFEMFNMLS